MIETKEFLNLRKLLINKEALIGIVGLGYVGLPLALAYAKNGFNVVGLSQGNLVAAKRRDVRYIKQWTFREK